MNVVMTAAAVLQLFCKVQVALRILIHALKKSCLCLRDGLDLRRDDIVEVVQPDIPLALDTEGCDAVPGDLGQQRAAHTLNAKGVGEGTEVYGDVENSVIGSGVTIEKGAVIRNSIIMNNATIGENAYMDKAIIAENVKIGKDAKLGIGEEAVNEFKPQIYSFGLVTIGENSVVPDGVTIGKNTAISGVTTPEDYPDGNLKSGGSIIKAGE